jgi:hypothetical protein
MKNMTSTSAVKLVQGSGIAIKGATEAPWDHALNAARFAVNNALGLASDGSRLYSFSARAVHAARPLLPYCLHEVSGVPGMLIWLNRQYKPLGTCSTFAHYEDFTWLHVPQDSPRLTRLRAVCACSDFGGFWLHTDYTSPIHSAQNARDYAALLDLVCLPDC